MKFFYTLLSIVFAGNIFGQTINSTSLPKVNSENSYYSSLNTDLNEISKVGNGQTWDISGVSGGITTQTKYELPVKGNYGYLYPQATYFINEGGDGEVYYKSDDTGIKLLGAPSASFINPGIIEKGEIRPPIFEIKTPMNVGDQLNQTAYLVIDIPVSIIPDSLLNTLPIKPDSLRLKITTKYNYECTGSGILKCPGKDFSVLQQIANITTISNAEAKVPFLGWIDVSNFVDFGLGEEDLITNITFWSPDHVGYVAQFQVRPDIMDIVVAKYTTEGTLLKSNDDQYTSSTIEIFPNPISTELRIKNVEGHVADFVKINSIDGTSLIEKQINNNEVINVSRLNPGLYIVNLYQNGQVIAIKKVIKL